MSKFCGNCGATLDDAAVVCGYCGAPLNNNIPGQGASINKAGVASVVKELKGNKIVKIAIPAVAALVVVIVAIVLITSLTGYKGAIKSFMKAYKDQDIDTMISMSSDIATDAQDDDSIEYLTEIAENHFEHVEDKCGDAKIKYEITNVKELSKSKLGDYKDLFDELDLDSSEVEEGKKITLLITYDGDKRTKTHKATMIMFKENGEWKFYNDSPEVYIFSDSGYDY